MANNQIQTDQFYHVYNRGVDGRVVFQSDQDYYRFLEGLKEFNSEEPVGSLWLVNQRKKSLSGLTPQDLEGLNRSKNRLKNKSDWLVEIVCYALLPNHFHLLLRQVKDGGISELLKRLGGGYTGYFNQLNNRSGSLFQGTYKAVHVDSDEYLLYLSGYINGNPEIHKITKADGYRWSSYSDYLGQTHYGLANSAGILKEFKGSKDYKNYTNDVIKESGSIKEAKRLYLIE